MGRVFYKLYQQQGFLQPSLHPVAEYPSISNRTLLHFPYGSCINSFEILFSFSFPIQGERSADKLAKHMRKLRAREQQSFPDMQKRCSFHTFT